MQLWERPCIVTGRNVSTLPKRNLTSVSPNFHLLLTESRLLACVLIQMYFVPCPLIHEQLHRCLQYTSHTMIHNSCDIDSRVWCCWSAMLLTKAALVTSLATTDAWAHCFKCRGNCLALGGPELCFLFYMPVSGQVHARWPGFAASKTFHLVTFPSGVVRGREVNNPNSGSGIPLLE